MHGVSVVFIHILIAVLVMMRCPGAVGQYFELVNHSTLVNYTEASDNCTARGGFLAQFPTQEAYDKFRSHYPAAASKYTSTITGIWLGAIRDSLNHWYWGTLAGLINGTLFTNANGKCTVCYCEWSTWEPSGGTENHLMMFANHRWNDVNPDVRLSSAACQYAQVPAEATYFVTVATTTADAQCAAVSPSCATSEFEQAPPTNISDRVCTPIRNCSVLEYETAAPTNVSNRECALLTQCNGTQYESTAPTPTSDRECTTLTMCQAPLVEVVAPTATSDRRCACRCANAVTANYKDTLVPDAGKVATTRIELDVSSWDVVFRVENVLSVTNGHVIAAPVDARGEVQAAIGPLVSNFTRWQLWNPPSCALSDLDVPAPSLGVAVELQTTPTACFRSFTIKYSLVDALKRTSHCSLSNTADEILVQCALQINTIRAYDATDSSAFLAKETVLRANITMPRTLPNEVGTLLHASLAKCSVYAAPLYYVDCRIPALWNFASHFAVDQSPNWIIDTSCAQTNGTDATYIRCDLQSISQIYTEATATIGATVLPSGEVMRFNVNYSLPREETAIATGALASFVKSIGTKDGKFFYGNDDLLTLEIEVVDTARLQITGLELFNSDSPVQLYDIRGTPQFELVESQNSTFFVITFYPARVLSDSNFYRHGPHGVNVTFLFTAARRQEASDKGVVTYTGLGLKTPEERANTQVRSPAASSISPTAVAMISASALMAIVAVVALGVVIVRRAKTVGAAAPAIGTCKLEATPKPLDAAIDVDEV